MSLYLTILQSTVMALFLLRKGVTKFWRMNTNGTERNPFHIFMIMPQKAVPLMFTKSFIMKEKSSALALNLKQEIFHPRIAL